MALWLWATLLMGYFALVDGAYSGTSETRETLLLDGVWNCYCESEGKPLEYLKQRGLRRLDGVVKMPLPGSIVDFISQMDPKKCLGVVWYERRFFVPSNWMNDRKIWLRFEGIPATTTLWVNGLDLAQMNKSYVPTECDVTENLLFNSENRIAISVDSRSVHAPGIPQSVSLRTTPEMLFIESVILNTTVTNGTASIRYKVISDGLLQLNRKCVSVQAFGCDCTPVAKDTVCGNLEGTVSIPNARLWWPMNMDPKPGYLYTLVFKLHYKYCDSVVRDVYREKIGIRTLGWSNNSLTVNGKNIYLEGAEAKNAWTRKSFNPRTDLKDIALLKWLNANTLATTLAPSEDMLDIADEMGLLVIIGSPNCAFKDVIIRYRNRPSVIMWSLSVGENCNSTEWAKYHHSLIEYGRNHLDSSRPYSASLPLSTCNAPKVNEFDIISLNLKDATVRNGSSNDSTSFQNTIKHLQKPVIIMHGDKFLSTKNRIQMHYYDQDSEFDDIFSNLSSNVTILGEFYGNLVAYEQYKDGSVTLVDGIFNQNYEPMAGADIIRTKFKEGHSPLPHEASQCKPNNKRRKPAQR